MLLEMGGDEGPEAFGDRAKLVDVRVSIQKLIHSIDVTDNCPRLRDAVRYRYSSVAERRRCPQTAG